MVGKRSPDYDAKAANLRAGAARLIAAEGFDRATLRRIGRGMGVSTGPFLHYFDSRDDLLWSIIEHHMTRLLTELEHRAPDTMKPGPRWTEAALACANVAAEHPAEHRTVLLHAMRLSPARQADFRVQQRWVLEVFASILEAAAPGLPQGHVKPLALSLLALLNAQTVWHRERGLVKCDAYARMAARMVLAEARQSVRAGKSAAQVNARPVAQKQPVAQKRPVAKKRR